MSGLYARIQSNNARSLALFGLFFLAAEALTTLMVATILAEEQWRSKVAISPFIWLRAVFLASWSDRSWIYHFSGYLCWFVVAWIFYSAVIKRSLDLKALTRAEDPVAYDIAEATAIAVGLRMPKLYVMECTGRNAFAFGLTPYDAALVLSRGLLRALNAAELEAVIAHEIAHIRGRDIRLTALATLSAGILFRIAWVQIAMVIQPSPQWLFVPLFAAKFFWGVLAAMLWSCAAIGVCVLMARLAISHAREFKADAEAVDITGNPQALISALRKLDGAAEVPAADFAVGAAMIVAPSLTWYSAHPPIADRIAALREIFLVDETATLTRFDQPVFSRSTAAEAPARREFGQRQAPTPTQPASWRELRDALRSMRPPGWVSHPYILLPAIVLNLAIDMEFGLRVPLPMATVAVEAPKLNVPSSWQIGPGRPMVNRNAREFQDPAVPLR